ncbi:MAG: hypothetical protein JSS81_23415 [Acidobacteria bacterium]|nr:hypothetical protein [Acidobacteriota bacterium]
MKSDLFRLALRGSIGWLVLIFAEIVHGTLRVIFLQPLVGDFRSRQIAVFSGAPIILAINYFLVRFLRAETLRQRLGVGFGWVLLTLVFEISFGRLLGFSWERIGADYDVAHGGLLPFGLVVMLFAPLIAAKIKTST